VSHTSATLPAASAAENPPRRDQGHLRRRRERDHPQGQPVDLFEPLFESMGRNQGGKKDRWERPQHDRGRRVLGGLLAVVKSKKSGEGFEIVGSFQETTFGDAPSDEEVLAMAKHAVEEAKK